MQYLLSSLPLFPPTTHSLTPSDLALPTSSVEWTQLLARTCSEPVSTSHMRQWIPGIGRRQVSNEASEQELVWCGVVCCVSTDHIDSTLGTHTWLCGCVTFIDIKCLCVPYVPPSCGLILLTTLVRLCCVVGCIWSEQHVSWERAEVNRSDEWSELKWRAGYNCYWWI